MNPLPPFLKPDVVISNIPPPPAESLAIAASPAIAPPLTHLRAPQRLSACATQASAKGVVGASIMPRASGNPARVPRSAPAGAPAGITTPEAYASNGITSTNVKARSPWRCCQI